MAFDPTIVLSALPRLVKHRWQASNVQKALPDAALARLSAQVSASELLHTGQIRICAEGTLPWSYLRRGAHARERAVMLFSKLRVWDTDQNNGVLIYLLIPDHAIEIVADRGLASRVTPQEWNTVVSHLSAHLRDGKFEEGLSKAIDSVTASLVAHYGRNGSNSVATNELPDAPSVSWRE